MILRIGVIARISRPLPTTPVDWFGLLGESSCITNVTVAEPPGTHRHFGGFKCRPLQVSSPFATSHLPAELPSTDSIVAPFGPAASRSSRCSRPGPVFWIVSW